MDVDSLATVESLDGFLEGAAPPAEPQPGPNTEEEIIADPNATPPTEGQEPQEPAKETFYSEEQKAEFKSNKAFAAMRNENRVMLNALGNLAVQNGFQGNTNNINEVAQFIDENNLIPGQQQATQPILQPNQNPQTMAAAQEQANQYSQIVTRLSNENRQLRQEHTEFLARQGFARLQQLYNLSQEDLEAYGEQLGTLGLDPWNNPQVNVIDQFKLLNFDTLVEREAQRKADEVLAREKEAQNHSTNPGGAVSRPASATGAVGEIKTIRDLDALLDSYETKG